MREGAIMPTVDLTARLARESKPAEKDTILFDKALPGFGLRIHPSGRKVWIVQARIERRSRRIVIARHGEMELAEARRRSRVMLGRIRAGENPADEIRRDKQTRTLREFAGEYLRRCEPHWKPSGRKTVRNYVKSRILPTFGRMPLDRIGPEDVAEWFAAASKDRPGTANRAFEILRSMMFPGRGMGIARTGHQPLSRHRGRTRESRSPGSSTWTNWLGSGARWTRTNPAGPRPSLRSGCWRSPVAAEAKC